MDLFQDLIDIDRIRLYRFLFPDFTAGTGLTGTYTRNPFTYRNFKRVPFSAFPSSLIIEKKDENNK